VHVGKENAGELSVDVDLEIDPVAWHPSLSNDWEEPDSDIPLFAVTSVYATIPGFSFTFSESKHWILNKLFVRPILSGSVGKRALGGMVGGQVRSWLEALEGVLRRVRRDGQWRGVIMWWGRGRWKNPNGGIIGGNMSQEVGRVKRSD